MVAGAAVVSVAGFFGDTQREAIVLVGVLLLLLDRAVPLPRLVAGAVQVVAAASLWIYLTQWQVYPGLEDAGHPYAAVLAALAVGIVAHLAWGRGRSPAEASRRSTDSSEVATLRSTRQTADESECSRGQAGRVTTNRQPGAWLDTAT